MRRGYRTRRLGDGEGLDEKHRHLAAVDGALRAVEQRGRLAAAGDRLRMQLLDPVGKDVALTSGEFDILKTFAENPNRPLSRDWLLETTSHRCWR